MPKKWIVFLLSVCFVLMLTGCGNVPNEQNPPTDLPSREETEQNPEEPELSPDTEDSKNPFVSAEAMQKIEQIYDNASIEPQTVTTVQQLAILTSYSASQDGTLGPITVTAATLNGEQITLVTLGGTQIVEGQATTLKESQLSMFGKRNDYLIAVETLIENGTIPSKKPLLVAGISLGGMIAQQILQSRELLQSHEIEVRGVICFGSPLTMPLEHYGVPVVRFADANDPVPKTENMVSSLGGIKPEAMEEINRKEKIVRESAYSGIDAHAVSYVSEHCWDEFDFAGSPNRENVLELNERMCFYAAPKRS